MGKISFDDAKRIALSAVNNYEERTHDGWEDFIAGIDRKFRDAVNDGKTPVFTTDARGLWDNFMAGLPLKAQQHYNCRTCRKFIERYGGLVTVDKAKGELVPIMWRGAVPVFFVKAVANMEYQVKHANITGVFVTGLAELGSHRAGGWSHMAVEVPLPMRYRDAVRTPHQKMASYKEDHRALLRALDSYSSHTIRQARAWLWHGGFLRADKITNWVDWFEEMTMLSRVSPRRTSDNLLWLAVAQAPTGYCHVKGSVLGALLDDIEAGKSAKAVREAHNARTDPVSYQRPKSAPLDQNADRAEEIVEKLGLKGALRRRFADMNDVRKTWIPASGFRKPHGVFDAVRPAADSPTGEEAETITWAKFSKKILPDALEMEAWIAPVKKYNLCALVTAVERSAPPILKWDHEGKRNRVSWFVYSGGSLPREWGLKNGYNRVTAVVPLPEETRPGVVLTMEGAMDPSMGQSGSALFPEILRPELYEVRKTVEAYSQKTPLSNWGRANACGLLLPLASGQIGITLRVRTKYGVHTFHVDRWD